MTDLTIESKVTPSSSFCPTNKQKSEDIQIAIMRKREKMNDLYFKRT